MPRPALIVALLALGSGAAPAAAIDPHLDLRLVPGGCRACHEGHGMSRSPMLRAPQKQVCLACHDSRARADEQVRAGLLDPQASPPLLDRVLSQPFVHPLTETAFSRFEDGAVTCTSCHSPHRGMAPAVEAAPGRRKVSTRNPLRAEYELCEECHGSAGPTTQDRLDLSRRLDPQNGSFHPIHGATAERSPSTIEPLKGGEISCTNCHTSSLRGPRGPHGSGFSPLLAHPYALTDGVPEGAATYTLCYSCHERERVLDSPLFPLHRLHVVDARASCATCHDPHGSVENRALIRFGDGLPVFGISASPAMGRLEFQSDAPGTGSCALLCHGVDHAPMEYGAGAGAFAPLLAPPPPGSLLPGGERPARNPVRPERARDRETAPPPP